MIKNQIDKAKAFTVIEMTTSSDVRHNLRRLIGFGWTNDQIFSLRYYVGDLLKGENDKLILCAALDYMREQMSATN